MKPKRSPRAAPDRNVFDACPIPLLEEDISALRSMIAAWRARGIDDIRNHFERHPAQLREAIRSIRVVNANAAACRLHEVDSRDELLGPLGAGLDLHDRATLANLQDGILAIAEGREYVETASLAVTPSGKKLDVEARLHIPPEADPFPNVLVALVDMAAHRRLERRLEHDRAVLQALVDAIPDQVFLKDRDDDYLLANRALVEWAGVASPGDIVGKTDLDLFPREIAEKFRTDDRAIMASGEGRANIEEQIGSGEQRRWALTTKVPFRDEEGKVAGIVGIARDIDERKRLERRLQEERILLRTLIDTLPDAVSLKDRNGRYILANRALADLMGVSDPDRLVGRTDRDFFPQAAAETAAAEERSVIERRRGLVDREESAMVRGEQRTLLATKLPIVGADGAVMGVVSVGRDVTSFKRVGDALRDSERRYRAIVDEAPVGIFRTTLEGKIVHANPAFARIAGYGSPEELIAAVNRSTVAEALYWDPTERDTRVLAALHGKDWNRHMVRLRRRDGQMGVVTLTMRAIERPGGMVRDLEGFVEDITERTRAEEALAREHALLAMLMDTIPDHIYFKDAESRFIRLNRAHLALFGLSDPSQAVGKTDFDFFAREHAEKARQDEQRIIATGQAIVGAQERLTWLDRPDTWVSTTKMPLRDEHGEIVGTFGISRDITERRSMEERNLRLAALVDSSWDAIVGLDTDRRVTSWNRGAVRIYGYTPEEAMGQPASVFIPPELRDSSAELRERLQRGEFIENYETVRRRKDGKDIQVSLSLSPIRDTDGAIIGTASIARDITAQKALQAQIARAERLESLRILAGGIAHQFNNINAAVKGYLDILAKREELTKTARGYVELACKGIQRAVDITERMQGLSGAATAGGGGASLAEQIRDLVRLYERRIEEQGVALSLELSETPPVRMSETQVAFVVTSLITNALDAMLGSPRRVLSVRSGSAKEGMFLEVADTGSGIPPEGLAKLFTPFFTTKGEWAPPGSPQSAARGVGLSLAVCQSAVTESGGRIEVDGGEGTGATFRMWLPVSKPVA
jgi:PAS domain S-box-containing protein